MVSILINSYFCQKSNTTCKFILSNLLMSCSIFNESFTMQNYLLYNWSLSIFKCLLTKIVLRVIFQVLLKMFAWLEASIFKINLAVLLILLVLYMGFNLVVKFAFLQSKCPVNCASPAILKILYSMYSYEHYFVL